MNLNEWAKEIHQNAVEHGWWENERTLPEVLMLCVSELSEALEEDRAGNPLVWYGKGAKPEGVAVELADCMIRILDYCGRAGIDIENVVKIKHEYNKGREYRHGKRY